MIDHRDSHAVGMRLSNDAGDLGVDCRASRDRLRPGCLGKAEKHHKGIAKEGPMSSSCGLLKPMNAGRTTTA